jgi:hypothetical protein
MIEADVWLNTGDAALVLRHDGRIEVKALDHSFHNKNIVTCVGMMFALENVEWRKRLEERAASKWKTVLDGGVRSDD